MVPRLPISVVVPHLEEREDFFNRYCYPSIVANGASEVFVQTAEWMTAQEKRNAGAAQATQPFLFFCDDDIILSDGYLSMLYDAIDPNFDFAYGNYMAANHPTPGFMGHTAKPWDYHQLKQMNYISTMSLIRTEAFRRAGGFDERIERLQDWDLFLTLAENGSQGVYVPEAEFIAFYNNNGITKGPDGWDNSNAIVRRKHGI